MHDQLCYKMKWRYVVISRTLETTDKAVESATVIFTTCKTVQRKLPAQKKYIHVVSFLSLYASDATSHIEKLKVTGSKAMLIMTNTISVV